MSGEPEEHNMYGEIQELQAEVERIKADRDHYKKEMERLAEEGRVCHAKRDEFQELLQQLLDAFAALAKDDVGWADHEVYKLSNKIDAALKWKAKM